MNIKSTEEDKSTEAIFDRIGGVDAVAAVVDMFYERVLADPTLAYFFDGVNMELQKERQRQFITEAWVGRRATRAARCRRRIDVLISVRTISTRW